MNLPDITIGITSFLRHGYLCEAMQGIREFFPECPTIVADDSDFPMLIDTSVAIDLPFDSGLSKKRNQLVENTKTKYFLLGTDDFIFNSFARAGVEEMYRTLEKYPEISVASGFVNSKIYAGYLDYVPGDYIKEIRWYPGCLCEDPRTANLVHITANYFLARTSDIQSWEESLKIGGEHVMWFLKMRDAKKQVIITPANINTQKYDRTKQDPRYDGFRGRALEGHEQMKKLLNIKTYIDFDGNES